MENLLSIIIPCYNEEEMIPIFFKEIEKINLSTKREYIFIDDGSSDKTLNEIHKLTKEHPDNTRFISFSRNFGKEAAIYAGLKYAAGNYCVLMDVDLQDPPSLLPQMFEILQDNEIDCVGTRRTTRKGEPKVRSIFAKGFYKIINKISKVEIVDGARDYRMMKRPMVDAVLEIAEYNRFSKGIFSWVGFNTYYIKYENVERESGTTSWSFWSLFKYSIEGIVSYSNIPLTLVSYMGLFICFLAIVLAIIFAVRTLLFDNPTQGWTSIIFILLGLGGIQLFSLGILGEYIGKIFLEVKNRPIFLIRETEETFLKKKKSTK